jgi:sortase A
MKLVVKRDSLRWAVRWLQRALFTGGVALLAWCAFVLTDARLFQRAERRELDRLLAGRQAVSPASAKFSPPVPAGGMIGRLEIPRLGLSVMILEGTEKTTLRRAAGHIPGTPLPGQPGNVGISAHRDSFFRPLRNIRRDDIITLTTLSGEYRYRVVSTKIVRPSDVTVLAPGSIDSLTLVTCYPFYFVGAAPDRFIVRAERSPDPPRS